MMNLLLIGASGMIGSRILAEALARGHKVTATARDRLRIPPAAGLTAVTLDLSQAAQLTELARAADVVIAAVSPRSTDDAVAEARANGQALIAAAGAAGKRLVMVGGAGTLRLPDGSPVLPHVPEPYRAEATGMKAVHDALVASDLDWTFVAPALAIAPGPRRPYRLGTDHAIFDDKGQSEIGAEDFAAALLDEVETPSRRRGILTMGY